MPTSVRRSAAAAASEFIEAGRYPIRYLGKRDEEYPEILRAYPRMPAGIYVRGRLLANDKRAVAIVGARRCSAYGRNEAYRFAKVMAEHGIAVVSGMASGVDSAAHEGALDGGGRTIAVFGCGVDLCYPPENKRLYQRILESGGGLISEFETGAVPLSWHFPLRNRIISALSEIVLVVEARLKSGSLITADYALEQGKSVFAIPGRNRDSLSAGCNRLLAQGAGVANTPEALLFELGFDGSKSGGKSADQEAVPAGADAVVLAALCDDERCLEELCEMTGLLQQQASEALARLLLSGMAEERVRGYYTRRVTN